MAKQSNTRWTEIEVKDNKVNELSEVEINLDEEDNEDHGDQQVNDRDVSRPEVQTNKENKDSTVRAQEQPRQKENAQERTQVEDDDDQPGQSRRARRIRALSAEVQALRAQIAESEARANQAQAAHAKSQATNVVRQKKFYETRIAEKEAEYEAAVQANDAKAQAKALKELNDAQINHKVYEAAEADLPDEEEAPQAPQVRGATQQRAPEAAVRWVEKNQWFLKNQAAHMAARAVNAQLYHEGYDPNSEDYYEEFDARLEEGGLNLKKLRGEEEAPQAKPQAKRGSPVGGSEGDSNVNMGGVKRTAFVREGNKVRVTPSDADYEMADTMGQNIEDYMKNKLIYEEHGGKGYTPIIIPGQRK